MPACIMKMSDTFVLNKIGAARTNTLQPPVRLLKRARVRVRVCAAGGRKAARGEF